MKVYIGQINSTVGALSANAELIRRAYDDGVRAGADVVLGGSRWASGGTADARDLKSLSARGVNSIR